MQKIAWKIFVIYDFNQRKKNYEINYNDGNKWKISNYKNDKLDGTYVEYHKNGNKKKEVTFKDWKDISEKYYDTSGIALEV